MWLCTRCPRNGSDAVLRRASRWAVSLQPLGSGAGRRGAPPLRRRHRRGDEGGAGLSLAEGSYGLDGAWRGLPRLHTDGRPEADGGGGGVWIAALITRRQDGKHHGHRANTSPKARIWPSGASMAVTSCPTREALRRVKRSDLLRATAQTASRTPEERELSMRYGLLARPSCRVPRVRLPRPVKPVRADGGRAGPPSASLTQLFAAGAGGCDEQPRLLLASDDGRQD